MKLIVISLEIIHNSAGTILYFPMQITVKGSVQEILNWYKGINQVNCHSLCHRLCQSGVKTV